MTVAAGGGDVEPLTPMDGVNYYRNPVFLPDGDHYLIGARTRTEPGGAVFVSSLSKPFPKRLVQASAAAAYLAPDTLLYADEGVLYSQQFNPQTLELSGSRSAVASPVVVSISDQSASSAAREGRFVYRLSTGLSAALAELHWFDRSGRDLGPAGSDRDPQSSKGSEVDISPSGHFAAVARPTGSNNDIWILDLQRGVSSRLTSGPAGDIWPCYGPDDERVAFQSGNDVLASSPDGQVTTLLADGQVNRPSAWSRDGRYLLVRRESPSGGDLIAVDLRANNQKTPVAQSPFDETRAQFSPDSRWVSYESTESGRSEVYIQPFGRTGARIQVSSGGGTQARWNPAGGELFYISPDAQLMAVDLKTSGDVLAAGPPRALFPVHIFRGGLPQYNYKINYAVAPDGRRFLVALAEGDAQVTTPITLVLNWARPR